MGLSTRKGRSLRSEGSASRGVRPGHRRADEAAGSTPEGSALSGPVVRRLTGYDRTTERLAFQRDIPEESWNEAKRIARLPAATEVALASFPLADDQAQKIAAFLGVTLPPWRMDYFLEPFAKRAAPRSVDTEHA